MIISSIITWLLGYYITMASRALRKTLVDFRKRCCCVSIIACANQKKNTMENLLAPCRFFSPHLSTNHRDLLDLLSIWPWTWNRPKRFWRWPSGNDHYDDAADIVTGTATTAEALGATNDAGTGWTLFASCFCVKFVTV